MVFAVIILLIPIFFLFMFIFGKKNRKYIALAAILLTSSIIFIAIMSIFLFSMFYYPKEKFNAVKWNENIEERYKMSGDIIKNNILIDKTTDEIIELLGDDSLKYDDEMMIYYLGFVPGITIDFDILIVYFENGTVVKVEQRRT